MADMVTGVMDGGIIISKSLRDTKALPAQIIHFRNYVRLLFEP